MTPELIELEYMHIMIDKELQEQEGGGKQYHDDEYDQWDEDSENHDRNLADSDSEDERDEDPALLGDKYASEDEDDWEDID
jgi:hypothetical protein